ncbi:MAG: DEAD/DEAH box helicase family protein, partial [Acholeplasmataceae bacterium]|nr:DEAD/DEAH box helicase family protein [Acholeplasmataceae bacterium]
MKSQFVTNYTKQKFLAKIKESLQSCDGFYFSVSFIKKAGLILLLNDIKEALNRGAVGKIITSTYQNFTDILSLEEFLGLMNKYSNFDCHLNYSCFGENGFHTKGYLFKYANSYELVVGSSNITRYALLNNIEWNLAVTTNDLEDHYRDALAEFEFLWSKTYQLNRDLINKYSIQLDFAIEKWDMDYIRTYDTRIVPNSMQKKALKEIRRFRDMGVKKALVVAATGSGKTYLAAFDALNFDAKRVLFVVHRDTILKEAMKTFAAVFRERVTYGLFMAHFKEFDRDFIFTTNTTMSRNLHMFAQDEFDYIIFDEVHHAVAETYKKIIDYFKPQFMLGLTATPERMDNESVFDLFDKNLPYELRLREALENDLVVPFRYFGINDSLLDYSEENPSALIKQIADDLHCEFIKENIEKHRPSGKLKAIGFCRSIEHARIMTEKMNLLGYHTTFLSGRSDTGERLKAFSDLQADDRMLEIIFTVDLLNEGVDIPAINMALFLRPTESSTIFIQQLGRGLRKYESKEYLV